MSYPLFLTLHLFAALVFIGTVFFEVLFLESIRKQLPAKAWCCWNRASVGVPDS